MAWHKMDTGIHSQRMDRHEHNFFVARYAMASAASSLSPAGHLSEQFSGMSHLNLLKRLSQEDAEGIARKLQRIAAIVLSKGSMRVALNTSAPDLFVKATETFLLNLGAGGKSEAGGDSQESFEAKTLYQHYVTPFPINFTSLSIPTVSYSSPDSAPLKVRHISTQKKFSIIL